MHMNEQADRTNRLGEREQIIGQLPWSIPSIVIFPLSAGAHGEIDRAPSAKYSSRWNDRGSASQLRLLGGLVEDGRLPCRC
jgi:hypothetical protein